MDFLKKIFMVVFFTGACFIFMNMNSAFAMNESLNCYVKDLSKLYDADETRCVEVFDEALHAVDVQVYDKYKAKICDSLKKEAMKSWFDSNSILLRYQSDQVLIRNIKFLVNMEYENFRKYWIHVLTSYVENSGSETYELAKQMAEAALRQSKCIPLIVDDEQMCSQAIDRLFTYFGEDAMMNMYREKSLAQDIFEGVNKYDVLVMCFSLFAPAQWYDFEQISKEFHSAHDFAEEFKDTIVKVKEFVKKDTALCTVPKGDSLIIGDLHGNVYCADIFIAKAREQLESNAVSSVVFLGDYVDRGFFSTEVLYSIFKFKLQFPDRVFLLRGNHEMVGVCPASFPVEINCRFSASDASDIHAALFDDLFLRLPLAAELTMTDDRKVLCLHGGIPELSETNFRLFKQMKEKNSYDISPMVSVYDTASDMRKIFYSILWNDPDRPDGEKLVARQGQTMFSEDQLNIFLQELGYEYLIRGHECVYGILKDFAGKCCTVFSSHSYFDLNDAHMALATSEGLSDYMAITSEGKVLILGSKALEEKTD